VIANRIVVAGLVVLAVVVVADAIRSDSEPEADVPASSTALVIDLASSRDGTWHPVSLLREGYPVGEPASLAVSKVAVAGDGLAAIAVSHVPGDRPATAAIELWRDDELVRAFPVPPGSFSRGLWFAGEGEAIASIGWNGRGYLYDREGEPLEGTAYFAYETG
jgi:hypothetical protein